MNKQDIHYDLSLSLRRRDQDTLELRPSLADGYWRGFFRIIIIGIFCVIGVVDLSHGEPALASIYIGVKNDLNWTFNSDALIKEKYKNDLDYIFNNKLEERYPGFHVPSYEEYKKSVLSKRGWVKNHAYVHFIWPLFLLFLFFFPRPRGLLLDRKRRLIYRQHSRHTATVLPLPEQGDPLDALVYNRFGLYPFGGGERFSLELPLPILGRENDRIIPQHYGVYPSPDKEHNRHLLAAIRTFFNDDNPEFLNHIGRFYRIPWLNPIALLCNGFTIAWGRKRKRAEASIAAFEKDWAKKSDAEKQAHFARQRSSQQDINFLLEQQGLVKNKKASCNKFERKYNKCQYN